MKQHAALISKIQAVLREQGFPAWLFYGFHDIDPIGLRILQFPSHAHISRRWFYLVPARGEPLKLVHRIESSQLDHLPGKKTVYLRWEELNTGIGGLLEGVSRVAMQYSERNAIPSISRVDAGTVEWIRSFGTEVLSSGNLIQLFEAVWTDHQLEQHRESARALTSIVKSTFEKVAATLSSQGETDELAVQGFILESFSCRGLTTDFPPIVGVNQNSGNPHYAPDEARHSKIRRSDFLLIDLWAKPPSPEAVYADITWTGFLGETPPQRIQRVFEIVLESRDRGVEFLRRRLEEGQSVAGWQVDEAVRKVIQARNYGPYFTHRTGHNLGQEVHGNGVNFDNLETRDTRQVVPGLACTIEPGIYLDEFGVRSEINIFIHASKVEVTTPPQRELLTFPV